MNARRLVMIFSGLVLLGLTLGWLWAWHSDQQYYQRTSTSDSTTTWSTPELAATELYPSTHGPTPAAHPRRGSVTTVTARPSATRSARRSTDAPAYYESCADAKADLVTPLLRGEPGYRAGLDSDGDGVACE